MKKLQRENCSSMNAIKLQQNIKNARSSSVFEKIKKNISTDFILILTHQIIINDNLGINNNKNNNNTLKIKDNKVISKVSNDSSNVSSNNKINNNN